ncbi:MAG: pyridoxal-phosphate dependent enzyme [Betaproteobacteria bacterium]|nr:pyridoxal-phosphate dependent enzyme [Betaproteobacteria bacterium]MBK8689639.1 pyridoxal-phosphate dependent enzyme [Betaproteobacteria bacterium]
MRLPDLAAIRAAQARIAPHVHRTPVLTSSSIDGEVGARLHFKCENLQKIGAFKARGAVNAVFSLPADVAGRGVVTHSSGNHGAALAYAARRRGIPAWVVMPENAPKVKIANVAREGATIRFCVATVAAREAACAEVQGESGATLIHPFDNAEVIAGQGTAALELLADVPDLDAVVAPCGGGGLLSGTAIAAHGLSARLRVLGAEPAQADDAARSLASGRVEPLPTTTTIADGLRTTLSPRTLAALRAHVEAIGTCSEDAIVRAMRLIWERMKLVIEPSSAVPLACLLEGTLPLRGARVGVLLSGGNVDLDRLPWQA